MAENQGFFSGTMSPEETERVLDKELLVERGSLGSFLARRGIGAGTDRIQEGFKSDPRMQQAVKTKALQERVSSIASQKGIDFQKNPEEYTKLVTAAAFEMGMPDIGLKAIQQGQEFEISRRKIAAEEERNRILDEWYKSGGGSKAKDKGKKFVLPNSIDVKNILGILQGREELAGMDPKQMDNLSVRMAARIKELKDDEGVEFGDAFNMAYSEQRHKIKPARKRGLLDKDMKDWSLEDVYKPFDVKAEYDDSDGPITEDMVSAPKEKAKSKQAPPAALKYLKEHPETKDKFKATFGYLPEGF